MKSLIALAGLVVTGAVFGANIVPSTDKFPSGEASLADPALWGGEIPSASGNAFYLYVGDTFRYFMDGSDTTLTNEVVFSGTSFGDRSWVKPGTPQHLTIDLYNGAKFKATGFSISSGIDGSIVAGESSDHHLIVRDNAIFETLGSQSLLKASYDRMTIDVLSGGSLITTNKAAEFGVAATTQAITWWEEPKSRTIDTVLDARLRVENATWQLLGVTFGYPDNYKNIHIAFGATNAVIDNVGGRFWIRDDGDFTFGPGTEFSVRGDFYIDSGAHVVFDDATAPRHPDIAASGYNGDWRVGSEAGSKSRETVLTLKGNSEVHPTAFITSENALATNRIVVAENAKLCLDLLSVWYDYLRPSFNGVTYFELRDNGLIELVTQSQCVPFRLGINAGAYGQLDQSGGTFRYYGYGVWPGCSGSGVLNVSGGTFLTTRILLGSSASETETASFRQTGGLVRLANADGKVDGENGMLSVAHTAHPSSVSLEGGVLECAYVASAHSSYATVTVDGGTIRRYGTYSGTISDKSLIRNIGAFTVGAKGLVIDSNGADVTVKQTMSSVSGEAGFLEKRGAETLTLASGTYALDRLIATEGTILVDSTATVDADTRLTVTNGAAISLVGGATSLTVMDLVLSNGVIKIDAGDKIVVSGTTALYRLKVAFSSLPTVDQAADFLVVNGELDAASLQALRRAIFTNTLADGTHGALTATYDSSAKKTTVTVAVKTDVPLTDETAWRGSGAWATDANWSDGAPTASKVAVFDKDSATTAVSVGADAVAGAFDFSEQDFTLMGEEPLSMPAEAGSAVLSVSSGHSTVSVPLEADVPVIYDVSSNAALTVAKSIDGGGIKKQGYGRLELGADNAFLQPIVVKAGALVAQTDGALGTSYESDNTVSLVSGTLATTNATDAAVTVGQDLQLNAETATEPLILKTDVDTTVTRLTHTQGAFLKRGVGKLTLPFAADATLAPSWFPIALGNNKLEFADNGTVNDRSINDNGTLKYRYAPFTVVEGELVFCPVGTATPTVTIKYDCQIGRGSVGACAAGSLTIDGVTLSLPSRTLYHGFDMTDNDTGFDTVLRIVNGGKLSTGTYLMGEYCGNKCNEILAMTNGTIEANAVCLSGKFYRGKNCYAYAKDSAITATGSDGISATAGFDGVFVNTPLCATSNGKFGLTLYSYGTMRFTEGSTFGVWTLSGANELKKNFTISFDNSTWDVGDHDLTINSTLATSYLKVETLQEGHQMTVNVGADHTFTFADTPLAGAGGLKVTGGGTVAFGKDMLQFTGSLQAASGTLDLTDAGALTNATLVAGAGTIRGGTFHNATLLLDSFTSSTYEPFNFADCTFSGKTTVRIAGEPAEANDVAIANYTGTLAGAETFRLKGWKGYRGAFAARDGVLRADIGRAGVAAVILR